MRRENGFRRKHSRRLMLVESFLRGHVWRHHDIPMHHEPTHAFTTRHVGNTGKKYPPIQNMYGNLYRTHVSIRKAHATHLDWGNTTRHSDSTDHACGGTCNSSYCKRETSAHIKMARLRLILITCTLERQRAIKHVQPVNRPEICDHTNHLSVLYLSRVQRLMVQHAAHACYPFLCQSSAFLSRKCPALLQAYRASFTVFSFC